MTADHRRFKMEPVKINTPLHVGFATTGAVCPAASPLLSFKVVKSILFAFYRAAQFSKNTGRNSLIVNLSEVFLSGFNRLPCTRARYAKITYFVTPIMKKSIPVSTKFRFLYTKYREKTDRKQPTTGLAGKHDKIILNSLSGAGLREGLNGNPFLLHGGSPVKFIPPYAGGVRGRAWRQKDCSKSPSPLPQRGHAPQLLLVKNQTTLLSVINSLHELFG